MSIRQQAGAQAAVCACLTNLLPTACHRKVLATGAQICILACVYTDRDIILSASAHTVRNKEWMKDVAALTSSQAYRLILPLITLGPVSSMHIPTIDILDARLTCGSKPETVMHEVSSHRAVSIHPIAILAFDTAKRALNESLLPVCIHTTLPSQWRI